MNKTLAVCGDSWFASDIKYPGKSFGEILADQNGFNLLSLARGGCSNFAIALQIDKAIELKVDYVIVGTTTPDRIEIPMQIQGYDKLKGLSNIQYAPHPDLSSQHAFLVDPTIISESMSNLTIDSGNAEFYNLTSDQKAALKAYTVNLYDAGVKQQIDTWIISDACRRLTAATIPFLICIEALFNGEYIADSYWIPEKNKVTVEDFSLWNRQLSTARFHYDPDTDGIIIANYLQKRLEELS